MHTLTTLIITLVVLAPHAHGALSHTPEVTNRDAVEVVLSPKLTALTNATYFTTRILLSSTNTRAVVRLAAESPRQFQVYSNIGIAASWDGLPDVVGVYAENASRSTITHTVTQVAGSDTAMVLDVRPFASGNTTLAIDVTAGMPETSNRFLYLAVFADVDVPTSSFASARAQRFSLEVQVDDPTGTIAASVSAAAFVIGAFGLWKLNKKHRWCARMCSPRQLKDRRRKPAEEQQESADSSEYEYAYAYEDPSADDDDATSVLATSDATSSLYEYAYEDASADADTAEDTSTASDQTAASAGASTARSSKRGKKGKKLASQAASTRGGQRAGAVGATAARKRSRKRKPKKTAAEKRAEARSSAGPLTYVVFVFLRVLYLFFDAIRLVINLQLIGSSLSLYVDVPKVGTYEGFLPFGSFTTALFSPNAVLVYFEELSDKGLQWNCGGTLLLVFPWFIALVMAVFAVVLQRDLLLWVSIRLLGYRPKKAGRAGLMLFSALSALLQALLLYILQLFILILPHIMVGMWSVKRSCSAVDHQMLTYMYIANLVIMAISFVILLVSFAGRPTGNVGKLGILAPAAIILGSFRRLMYLSFGVWSSRLVESFSIVERAAEYDDDPDDDDTQHERTVNVVGRSRALIWMLLPLTIVLAKLSETINNPPLFVSARLEMATPAAFRAIILALHITTFALLLAVVFLGSELLFQLMFGSLVPLHLFLLCLDFAGASSEAG